VKFTFTALNNPHINYLDTYLQTPLEVLKSAVHNTVKHELTQHHIKQR